MESLGDHSRRRSSRDSGGGDIRLVNKLLLLVGALLFVNGITVTLITALIPVAVGSPVIVTLVTGCLGSAYAAKRYPERTNALRRAVADLVSREQSPQHQGGL